LPLVFRAPRCIVDLVADILLIDDDLDYLESFAEVLGASGHTVRVAAGGEEGLALLRDHLPDMVFLDIDMPIATGPDVAWRMCVENLGKERIPILFVSANPDLKRIAAAVGTRYFVGKPFDLRHLSALIDQIMAERAPPAWPTQQPQQA
jgi:DNA-binding response OmpR family regulator